MKKKSHCGTFGFGPSNLVWLDLREELVNRWTGFLLPLFSVAVIPPRNPLQPLSRALTRVKHTPACYTLATCLESAPELSLSPPWASTLFLSKASRKCFMGFWKRLFRVVFFCMTYGEVTSAAEMLPQGLTVRLMLLCLLPLSGQWMCLALPKGWKYREVLLVQNSLCVIFKMLNYYGFLSCYNLFFCF